MYRIQALPILAGPLVAAALAASELPPLIDTGRGSGEAGKTGGRGTREERDKELRPVLDQGDAAGRLRDLIEEGKANLQEIQRLLDEIEKNLAAKATGQATQEKQARVVEKMEELLKRLEEQCAKCSSSSGGSSGQKQRAEEEEKEKQEAQQPRSPEKSQAQLPKDETQRDAQRERNDQQVDNDRAEDASTPEAKAEALRRQLLEISRRWGLLPPKLREEAMFSTGREAPREYLEIISRYYKRLSEFYMQSSGR